MEKLTASAVEAQNEVMESLQRGFSGAWKKNEECWSKIGVTQQKGLAFVTQIDAIRVLRIARRSLPFTDFTACERETNVTLENVAHKWQVERFIEMIGTLGTNGSATLRVIVRDAESITKEGALKWINRAVENVCLGIINEREISAPEVCADIKKRWADMFTYVDIEAPDFICEELIHRMDKENEIGFVVRRHEQNFEGLLRNLGRLKVGTVLGEAKLCEMVVKNVLELQKALEDFNNVVTKVSKEIRGYVNRGRLPNYSGKPPAKKCIWEETKPMAAKLKEWDNSWDRRHRPQDKEDGLIFELDRRYVVLDLIGDIKNVLEKSICQPAIKEIVDDLTATIVEDNDNIESQFDGTSGVVFHSLYQYSEAIEVEGPKIELMGRHSKVKELCSSLKTLQEYIHALSGNKDGEENKGKSGEGCIKLITPHAKEEP